MRSSPSPVDDFFKKYVEAQLPAGFQIFREASDEKGRTAISLGPLEAGILRFLVSQHARPKWIELGTLTGFSAFCLANSLPSNGHLWTLEKDPAMASTARELLSRSGLSEKVTVVEGDAMETLKSIEDQGPFDGIFIDANKGAYLSYLEWAEKNLSKGSLVIADNVFLGKTLREKGTSEETESRWGKGTVEKMREFVARLMDPKKYQTTMIPTTEGLLVAKKI